MSQKELLDKFYTAFSQANAERMAECYHPEATFEDPAFGELKGESVPNMWRMLMARSSGDTRITYEVLKADEQGGEVKWEARYVFSQTGRKVHNKIHARIQFKDGLIYDHRDHFDFWRWSRMAMGWKGFLMGWTGFFKGKVRGVLSKALSRFEAAKKNHENAQT